jgi:hypothetical protein
VPAPCIRQLSLSLYSLFLVDSQNCEMNRSFSHTRRKEAQYKKENEAMLGVVDKPALTLLVCDMAWMLHVHCARLTFTPSDALHLRLAYQRQGLHVGDRRTYEMASIIVGWRLGM